MKFIFAVSISLLFALVVFAQSPAERYEKVRQLLHGRDDTAAIAELRSIAEVDRKVFEANNLDYLLARLYQRAGDNSQAASNFQSVRTRRSPLREYAAWHLADLARVSGNLAMERVLLLELLAYRPDSLLAAAANQRIAQSHFESKNYDAVIQAISSMPGETTSGQLPRELVLLRARALLYKGEKENARAQFELIVATTSNKTQPDDLTLEAAKGLDLIEVGTERSGKEVAKLSDYEHLKRAQIYQFNRDFADARLHFLAIVNNHASSGLAPDAIYQIGRGFTQTSNFSEAVKWYERVAEQFPAHPVNKDAALQLASAYARLERYSEAVSRYERFIKNFPDDDRIDRAYLNIIDVLRDAGEETEAVLRAQKAQEVFKGKVGEAQALFAQVRIRLARGDWPNALADLDRLAPLKELGGTTVPGGTTKNEITFLRAFVLEQLRRFPEAIDVYLSLPDGRNEYFGWRASDRLRTLATSPESQSAVDEKREALESPAIEPEMRRVRLQSLIRLTADEAKRGEQLAELRKVYSNIAAYKIATLPKPIAVGRSQFRTDMPTAFARDAKTVADELIFLGLFDEGAPEYEAFARGTTEAKSKKLSPEMEFTIASLYLKGDRADRPSVFIEQFAKQPPDSQPELLPDAVAELLYPAPYRYSLMQPAPPRNVDPRFLLAIMRQESRFRPTVKSVAAARGLMQFISDTSNRVAGELGREHFDQNELYHPPTAILFSSQYIGGLFKLFPDQPDAVAASYNGGEDNMKRWQGRSRSNLPERYVPEIAFSQSKDYVWRVMANYRMYQLLYDEKLNRL